MPFFYPKSRSRQRRRLTAGEFLEARDLLAFNPSPMEQEALEHVNRMRMDPQGELSVLFESLTPLVANDAEVNRAIQHFGVSSTTLQSQWAQLTAVPPLAWNENLSDAAATHNDLMAQEDMQAHQVWDDLDEDGVKDTNEPYLEDPLLDRVRDAGYDGNLFLENVYAFAEGMLHGHAGFVIDWGDGPDTVGGIQNPPGHRDNIMSGDVKEIGIAVFDEGVLDPNDLTDVGPFLITQEFGRQSGYTPQILGVFWEDGFTNGIYDAGEGYGGATITVKGDNGTFTTTTMSAGGYQLEVPAGTYEVIVSDQFLGTYAVGDIVVGNDNVKVDFKIGPNGDANLPPLVANDDADVPEGGSFVVEVLENDDDFDGSIDPTTVEIITQPQHGSVSVNPNTGEITYTSFAGSSGTDSFRYLVRDDDGASGEANVSMMIAETNDPPIASDASFTVDEDVTTPLLIEQFVMDPDGTVDWSTLQITQLPTRGTATPDGASRGFTYRGQPNFSGTDMFDYRVADDSGALSNVATISLTVTNVNDAPLANDDLAATVADITKVIDVFANDTDVDSNLANGTVEVASQPQNGSATPSGASVQYTPTAGFMGADTFTYRISDDNLAPSGVATVTVFVADPATPWRNPENALDVFPDGVIEPLDALRVISFIGLNDISSAVAGLETAPPPFLDVNGNNVVDPLDALPVIAALPSNSNAPLSGRVELATPVAADESDVMTGLPTAEITNHLTGDNPRDLAVQRVLDGTSATRSAVVAQATDVGRSSLSKTPRRWLAAIDSGRDAVNFDIENLLDDLAVDVMFARQ
jgi:hypothetical protein